MFGFKKKNYLKRTDFINSTVDDKIWTKTMTIPEIKSVLERLENELSKYEYKIDKNFIMNRRRKILKEYIDERLQKVNNINELASESLFNFFEFIEDEYPGNLLSTSKELAKPVRELETMDQAYRNKGIVCAQEKDVILEMIKTIKNLIEKG